MSLSALRTRLRELYLRAGEPGYRAVATRTGAMSHTTAHAVIRCERLPRWGQVKLVVEALDGEVDVFHTLWISARTESDEVDEVAALREELAAVRAELLAVRRERDELAALTLHSHPTERTLTGYTGPVTTLAFHPRGHLMASAGPDGIRLWDTRTWRPTREPLPGHVYTMAFHLRGHLLATGGLDGTVRLWDTRTWRPASPPLAGHPGAIWTLAFEPTGQLLATGGADTTVRLWHCETSRPAGVLKGHAGHVYSVAFHPTGHLIATADDETIRFWGPREARTVREPLHHRAHGLAFHPTGHTLAIAEADHVRLWDTRAWRPTADLEGAAMAFHPKGHLIATATKDTIHFWTVTGTPARAPLRTSATTIAFHPRGHLLATTSETTAISLWQWTGSSR
ncbi:WD40 repeat domain-containing protein [Spongiactinospora sp. TRM90649]|uniref:WD40 repeat domain-containing protein n=1 Tax=Spongiactinospora sp. TRM90649 TaxID=3031114 RepID=UPI0023F9D4A3|nr:WD40 repeat domain-containing protein [Spongiactinospora sp. TRM90649]MDF5753644.1 WD40 repeat domain-containing protein [Spongiactinospora sp. TRM90649]